MKKLNIFVLFAMLLVLSSCGSVALTGRRQVLLYPDSEILALSQQSYNEFNTTARQSADAAATAMVKGVCSTMVKAMEEYFKATGQSSYMQGLQWKVDLVQSNEVNAFALPSGNIVVYEGMLGYADTPDLIATVIGHEMAHAIAKHSNERMSTQAIVGTAVSAAEAAAANSGKMNSAKLKIFNTALGIGGQYGVLLPFSRKQEYEADRIGLIIMAIAGYDITQAPILWERMSAKGSSVPEFLSTHPSDAKRIKNLQECMKEAESYRKQP